MHPDCKAKIRLNHFDGYLRRSEWTREGMLLQFACHGTMPSLGSDEDRRTFAQLVDSRCVPKNIRFYPVDIAETIHNQPPVQYAALSSDVVEIRRWCRDGF